MIVNLPFSIYFTIVVGKRCDADYATNAKQ